MKNDTVLQYSNRAIDQTGINSPIFLYSYMSFDAGLHHRGDKGRGEIGVSLPSQLERTPQFGF
jgi:hypothetical protein